MTSQSAFHTPVLCHTVLETLITSQEGVYVDATLGGGGHSEALVRALSPGAHVIGIDRDRKAIETARSRLAGEPNFTALHGTFGALTSLLDCRGIHKVNGLLLDLGVSSHQLDCARRGFSHRFEGVLDMRMDQQSGTPARTLVNAWSEEALARVLLTWGEEPRARRIARAIVSQRPVADTTTLAAVVRRAVPERHEAKTLARVFQAIRIAVNSEIKELESLLAQAPRVVSSGGRLVVISYHSLEDRRVKRMMRHGNLQGESRRDLYGHAPVPWRPLLRKPVTASDEEVKRNPRARSAKLRAAERTRVPYSSPTP